MIIPQLINNGIIQRIEKLGGVYDPESNLSLEDQLLICETLVNDSTPVDPDDWDGRTILRLREENTDGVSVSVNGSVNDIGKRQENAEETQRKKQTIAELATCNYRTSPKKLASLLQIVFSSCITQDGHWLFVAQHYTPKSINSVIRQMTKAHVDGWVTIKSPAGYFTDVLKLYHPLRKRRKSRTKLLTKI